MSAPHRLLPLTSARDRLMDVRGTCWKLIKPENSAKALNTNCDFFISRIRDKTNNLGYALLDNFLELMMLTNFIENGSSQ